MTANGISTAESGTKLKSMFDELSATGSDVDEILKEVGGMSFKQMMENGYDTADALKILEKYASDNNLTMSDLFGSTEAASAAMILAKDNGDAFKNTLNEMKNSAGAANDNFKTVDDTLSSKLAKSVETIKNAFIKLGEKLVPIIADKIVPMIEKFTDWVANLSDESIQNAADWIEWGVKVGAILAVGGKVTSWIGNIMNLVTALSGAGGLAGAASTTGGALSGLGGIGAMLSNPAGWVALGVGTVVGLTTAFKKNQEQLDKNQKAFDETAGKFEEFKGKLRTNDDFLTELFGEEIEINFQSNIDEVVAKAKTDQDTLLADLSTYYTDKYELDHDGCLDMEKHYKHIEEFNATHQKTMEIINSIGKEDFTEDLDYQEEQYKNYLKEEYKMTEEGREDQAKAWRKQAETKADIYNKNSTRILEIVESCNGDLETLDKKTNEELQKLQEENANIKVEIEEATAETIDGIMTQINVKKQNNAVKEKKLLNERAKQEENYTKNVYREYAKQSTSFIENENKKMEKLRESNNTDASILAEEQKRSDARKAASEDFARRYGADMEKCMTANGNMEETSRNTFRQIVTDLQSGKINTEQYGNSAEEYLAIALQQMINAGAGADELAGAISAIPKDKRAQVLAQVTGTNEANNLRIAINKLYNKDIYVTTHYRAAYEDTGTASTVYHSTRTGNDYTMYIKAHGEEGFMPKTPKKAFAAGNEGFIPETEIANAVGDSFMFKNTLAKAIGGAVGNARDVLVGEQGPEIVQLPQGAKVKTHRETNNIINKTEPQIIQVVLDGKVIAQAIAPYTGKALADRVNKERW